VATEHQVSAREPAGPTFELKRFVWAAPDRLELSGTFGGLQDAPVDDAPMLVVRAGESVHRLPAVADSLDRPPNQDGGVWQAAFAWQDAPVAFDVAELHLGGGLVVELPEPSAKRLLSRTRVLQVRTSQSGERQSKNAAAASVASQVEVLAAQEEVREARIEMEQTAAELARAREDLKAERERRAGDSERYRQGLAKVRESAEQALAEAHEASEAKDSALETLRGRLEEAAGALKAAAAKARTEAEAHRERVAKLESDAEETARLRTELEQAYGSVEQARGDAERILARLTAVRAK
jgi:colicin import membrane protein